MSNLTRSNIYLPQALFFEMQQFRTASVWWVSGFYNTYRVKCSTYFPLEILKKKIRFKQSISRVGFFFFQTNRYRHLKLMHQKISLLHVLMNHWIIGNLVGFQNALRVRGVGYRFDISPLKITIQAGYSHLLFQKIPLITSFQSIILNKKSTQFILKGSNLMHLNLYLSTIRNLRHPDIYKGKGLRYGKDSIIRKEGKKRKN